MGGLRVIELHAYSILVEWWPHATLLLESSDCVHRHAPHAKHVPADGVGRLPISSVSGRKHSIGARHLTKKCALLAE